MTWYDITTHLATTIDNKIVLSETGVVGSGNETTFKDFINENSAFNKEVRRIVTDLGVEAKVDLNTSVITHEKGWCIHIWATATIINKDGQPIAVVRAESNKQRHRAMTFDTK